MGGVNMNPQIRAVRRGVDILVATPGRLLDLMNQGHVKLDRVEFFVLDEADRMLDMGFIHDVRKIASTVPTQRQTLFFSATMPAPVAELAHTLLRNPARVDVAPVALESRPQIEQRLMYVGNGDKQALLVDLLRKNTEGRILVFARTKHRADRVARKLNQSGIRAEAIHGNKTQGARVRTLEEFTNGRLRVLVATDIVARGIDVEGISHVVNFDLSDEPENYIHRIGRTARAGATGKAVAFCDPDEVSKLRQIEKLLKASIEVDATHPFHIDGLAQRREPQHRPAARQGGQRPPHQGPRKPRWSKSRRGGPRGSRRQPAMMA
jgi:ATP-dependent RNA helicase RhlE